MGCIAGVIISISWLLRTLAAIPFPSSLCAWVPFSWRKAAGAMTERVLPHQHMAAAVPLVEGVVSMLQQGDLRAAVEVMLLTWLGFEEAGSFREEGSKGQQDNTSCWQVHLELLLELQSGPVHIWQVRVA